MLLLAAIPVLFVGNQACAPCHSAIFRSYAPTPMATSSSRELPLLTPGSFTHARSRVRYEIHSTGLIELTQGERREQRQLAYSIGSGAAGRSFGYLRNGFLFEAPVTWYTQIGSWDVSPGYAADTVSAWNRPIEPSCLFCHASQIRAREGTVNGYGDPAFGQDGIACERCHGPGSLHVEGKGRMVNPAALAPARRDAVCAQCHLTGRSRVARAGRQITAYRAGDLLSDFVAYFVPAEQGDFQVNSHVEKLSQSGCKRASGDKLWCGSCHDPHSVPAESAKPAFYRAKCLTCHQPKECDRGFDCASCHMPRNPASDAGHGVFTDHSIPRTPGRSLPKPPPSWRLREFTAADRGDRELGLAYAEVGVSTGDRRQLVEAIRLLTAAPQDPEVQVRLADLQERAGNTDRAAALYRDALRTAPDIVLALVNLGRIYGSKGRLDEAIALWRDALKRNPCLVEAGSNLQIALEAKGDRAGRDAVRRDQEACVFGRTP
jgi:hypothetical protein